MPPLTSGLPNHRIPADDLAAARHQSFTHAALKLHVTHSAISRQIKALEPHPGVWVHGRDHSGACDCRGALP